MNSAQHGHAARSDVNRAPADPVYRVTRIAVPSLKAECPLAFPPGSRGQGFNSVLKTTHRQNFIVPPREHRSFPLAELV